jgi:23S rRNA (pseudouridine1915-N3)-methyltransferase
LTPELARRAEGGALFKELVSKEVLVVLDQRGSAWTSEELAKYVGDAQLRSRDVAFVVGGDEGLDQEVLHRAEKVLSLSKMTLPHRMARLLLLEQLYRVFTILRGEPYHK